MNFKATYSRSLAVAVELFYYSGFAVPVAQPAPRNATPGIQPGTAGRRACDSGRKRVSIHRMAGTLCHRRNSDLS